DHKVLRRQHTDERATGLTEARQVQPLERRMILDVVRRRAVCLLPDDVAAGHVVSSDAVVWRLDEWKPLHRCAAAPARGTWCSGATRGARTARTRSWSGRARLTGDVRHVRLRR